MEKVDKQTKLKALEITNIMYVKDYMLVNWISEYIGFGQFVCDYGYNVVDDEHMGKEFSDYMISLIKKQISEIRR